jgi:hypothetical protein
LPYGNQSQTSLEETVALIVALEDICSPALTSAVCIPQTPSRWLLARYDRVLRRTFGPQGDGRRVRHDRGSNFDRRIFDLIDDHPGANCEAECAYWSGEASWPAPTLGENVDTDVLLETFDEIA